MIDLSHGIKCGQKFLILSQFTRLTDRQTDGQTNRRTVRHFVMANAALHSM